MSEDIAARKAALRRDVRARRAALEPAVRAQKSANIAQRVLAQPAFARAASVLAFAGFGDELDTRAILEAVLAQGKQLVLPRVVSREAGLAIHVVDSLAALVRSAWGIDEPDPARCPLAVPASVALVLVPGVAFDRRGHRLGYGRAYYDRLLARLPPSTPKIALAFQEQLVDRIPDAPHDQRVDAIVTDQELILIS